MKIDNDILLTYFTEIFLKKGDVLLKAGDIENFLYYIESGIVRMYHYDVEKDKENTLDFILSGQFACAYESFKEREPSFIDIEALTMVHAYKIEKEELEKLIGKNPKYLYLKINVLEDLFIRKIEKEIMFLKESPETIYLTLLKKEPYLIKMIPLKYLASFIGITPQALSRIRKRIF